MEGTNVNEFSIDDNDSGIEDIFADIPENVLNVMRTAYMCMSGYAWLLYEKEEGWFIKVIELDDSLDKYLLTKIRVTHPMDAELTIEDMHIDFAETNCDELTKYKILYYTERNKSLLLDVFRYKFSSDEEELEDYRDWVIKE